MIEIFDNWAFDEVISYGNLDTKTRVMMIIGSNIACQALTEYKMFVSAGLNVGVTPVEIKEILYQSVPYVGIAKVIDFIHGTNKIFVEKGIELPLKGQSTTTPETQFEKGLALQKSIFGDVIDNLYKQSPENQLHIQKYLSANCFGDYYTRNGLDMKTRELLTFDFSGKTIIPFCTHEGSGLGNSERDIKKLCPNAEVKSGLAIRGGSVKNADNALKSWIA